MKTCLAKSFRTHLFLLSVLLLVAGFDATAQPISNAPTGGGTLDGGEDIGGEAAVRLAGEKPNDYRYKKDGGGSGQSQSVKDVHKYMAESFEKLLVNGDLVDKATSPHLRDIVPSIPRARIVQQRVNEALLCPFVAAQAAAAYGIRSFDVNFKTCCVRRGDKPKTSQQLVCEYPRGDAWSGLFEFWAPTTAIEWSNQAAQGVFATVKEFKDGLAEVQKLKEGQQGKDFVKQGIESAQKAAGLDPKKPDDKIIEETQQDLAKETDQGLTEDTRNTTTNRSGVGGVTVRPNFAWLSMSHRKALAEHFCMHPNQFDKIMHGSKPENPYQKVPPNPGASGDLKFYPDIPPFGAPHFANGWILSSDVRETMFVKNIHANRGGGKITELDKGYMNGYKKLGPLYCDKYQQDKKTYWLEGLPEVLDKVEAKAPGSLGEVGYSCWGESMMPWSPVVLGRYTPSEHRSPSEVVQWLIAAAYYNSQSGVKDSNLTDGNQQSYYVAYEPQAYYGILGKQYKKDFVTNELSNICRDEWEGEAEKGAISDHFWASAVPQGEDKNYSFIQGIIKDASALGIYFQKWAKKNGELPTRGLDYQSINHATSLRFFASCPAGYEVWDYAPPQCFEEKLW